MLSYTPAWDILKRESLVDLIYSSANIPFRPSSYTQTRMETELARLFITDGAFVPNHAHCYSLPRLSTSSIQLIDNSNPTQLSPQIAKLVYGGIGHE